MIIRRKTTSFAIGSVKVGSDYPITIQSMTNTDTRDIAKTLKQINDLKEIGCEIIRVAVPDEGAATCLKQICKESPIPVIADIHFDYRLALIALESGISGLRINPGNIGKKQNVREVLKSAQFHEVPIRIGVNAGSLDKSLLKKHGEVTADALVESAMQHVEILEQYNFEKIKISLKASNVPLMIQAYLKISKLVPYPLHLGVTEAGTEKHGTIKSAVGIGSLLAQGIGDTIRVSLTGNPLKEIPVAKEILRSLGIRKYGVELISCPTCGRCEIDLDNLVEEVDKITTDLQIPLKIAIMGCIVNGPGEARDADLGIAGGKGEGLIFRKGKIIAKVPEDQLLSALITEIKNIGRSETYENE